MRKHLFFLTAWVLILVVPSLASNMSVGKDRVNVRAKPSLKADILYQAYLGYPIEVQKSQKDWVYCEDWQGNSGWVYKPLLSKTQTAIIMVDEANIRKGPSLRNSVVAKGTKGEIYKIFGEKGDWVRVGYYVENEVIGWVRQDMVWGD